MSTLEHNVSSGGSGKAEAVQMNTNLLDADPSERIDQPILALSNDTNSSSRQAQDSNSKDQPPEREAAHHLGMGPSPSPWRVDSEVKASRLSAPQPDRPSNVIAGLQSMSLKSEDYSETSSPWDSNQPVTPPAVPEKDSLYLDPTPRTPQASRPPSRIPSTLGEYNEKDVLQDVEEADRSLQNEKKGKALEIQTDKDDQAEILSIMDQFTDESGVPRQEEIMSPRLELAGPMPGGQGQFPLRKSSLEPMRSNDFSSERRGLGSWPASPIATKSGSEKEDLSSPPPVPPKSPPYNISSPSHSEAPLTPTSSIFRPPPPEPEPDLPFDFHRFLEQLRHRTADPVAKYLRSFLTEFGKKQWMVHEQVKLISDFLAFITNKMAICEVWRDVSDAEFDNVKEGMEKLVMNRLYSQTFSPAIAPLAPVPKAKGKRKEEKSLGSGRRGQHQEDVERDDILAQKIRIYGWVREEHLDISSVGHNGKRFLTLAQQGKQRVHHGATHD